MEIRVTRVQKAKSRDSIVRAFVSIEIYLSNEIWIGIKDFKIEERNGTLSVNYPTLRWVSKGTGKEIITPLVRLPARLFESVQKVILGAYNQFTESGNTITGEFGNGNETK